MGLILSRTFEGVRVKVPTEDDPKLKLDCMFFTATCEPLQKKEDVVCKPAKYKSIPTFILCNPNAMFY